MFENMSKKCLEYFIAAFFTEEYFLKYYSKKDLMVILQKLFPYAYKDSFNPFSDMCKRRMIKHIKFYYDLKNFSKHNKEFWEEMYILKTKQEENNL